MDWGDGYRGYGCVFQLSWDDDGVWDERGAASGFVAVGAGGQQPGRVQFDGVVVGRRRPRYCVVVWWLLLHSFLVGHGDHVDWVVDLERRKGELKLNKKK